MLELQSITTNIESYEERSIGMLRAAATRLYSDPDVEVERFRRIMSQLRQEYDDSVVTQDPLSRFQTQVVQTIPNIVEFALTYSEGALQAMGYLTQGKPAPTLPMSLTNLLANGFKIYLAEGGALKNAEFVADLFALAFPNLEALAEHSPMAQGMLWGFVPRGDHLALKLYLNTRLGVGGTHRDRVLSMMERAKIDALDCYDRIYESSTVASFHGVGMDVSNHSSARLKLYTRIPREHLADEVRRITASQADWRADDMIEQCERLMQTVDGPLLSDDIELAIGVASGPTPTFKCTAFFVTESGSESSPILGVRKYLEDFNYDTGLLDEMAVAAGKGIESGAMENHPIHGVGIELGRSSIPKINLYLRPLI